MGIDRESDVSANLQIGPTTLGMVRLYISTDTVDLPLDFEPEEAEDEGEGQRDADEGTEGHAAASAIAFFERMRVMRTPKCSPSTTTSPSAKRRSPT